MRLLSGWSIPVIHHTDFQHLTALANHHSSCVSPLSFYNCKSPDLPSSPPSLSLDEAFHQALSVRSSLLTLTIQPLLLQVVIIENFQRYPPSSSLQFAKDMICVLPELPVERAHLAGTFDAAGGGLVDIYVGNLSVVDVLLDVERDGCDTNRLSG